MNTIFGSVSQDFLPPGYGEIPSKTVQRVSEPDPVLPNPIGVEDESYGGDGSILQGILSSIGGGTTVASDPGHRDLTSGEYKYRQFANNSIEILGAPGGQGVGTKYAAGSKAADNVVTQFGAYPASGGAVSSSGAAGASGATGATSATSSRQERGAAIGAGIGAAAAQLLPMILSFMPSQEITPYDDEYEVVTEDPVTTEEGAGGGSALPWILGGVGVLTLGGLILFAVTRGGDGEEE